ncbi:hypothetical protein ACWDO7_22715 [Streptomyces sp. NPDC003656]
MRTNLGILAASTLAVLAVVTSCSSGTSTPKSSKPSHSYAPGSVGALCRAQHWPQPMPDVKGKDPLTKSLDCFDHIRAIAPDGHDVMDDPANTAYTWKIVSSTPAAGAQVRLSTPITLKVRGAQD